MKYEIVARQADLKVFENFIVPVFSDIKPKAHSYAALLSRLLGIDLAAIKKQEKLSGSQREELLLRMTSRGKLRRVLLLGFGKQRNATPFLIRRRLQRAGTIFRSRGYRNPVLFFPDHPPSGLQDGMEAALVGFALGSTKPYKLKSSKKVKGSSIAKISVFYPDGKDKNITSAIKAAKILAPAICGARDLVDRPANLKGPEDMVGLVSELVGKDWAAIKVTKVKNDDPGGFPLVYSVGKGSARKPYFVEMRYRPDTKEDIKSVVLVGKGVIFDTGGLNIKSFGHMGSMKDDMAGAATVAGVMAAASRLGLNLNITALLPLVENTPSAEAYRPGDILTARNGKTIEVISTDAEGRLIMADALVYGAEMKPDYMIDVATLTGACVVALGPYVGGLFSNDDLLAQMIEDAASRAGELFWRLPMVEMMMPFVRSDIADIRNTLSDPYGGAIGAALFLREFVGKTAWAHLDVAGPAFFDKRYELGPKGGTGFSVHTLVRFLERLSHKQ